MEEVWKDIPSLDGLYEASSLGRVRSKERTVEFKTRWGGVANRKLRSVVLSQQRHPQGYMFVSPSVNGKHLQNTVHNYIADAFLGARPSGTDVNHIDGDKTNNSPCNLEYVTRKENMLHAKEIGIWNNSGERNGQARADENTIRNAHFLLMEGFMVHEVQRVCKLTKSQVAKIRCGTKWKHLGLCAVPRKRKCRSSL